VEDYAGTMKTNSSARYLVRIRVIMVCAALAAIVGLELSVSESLAARIGQTTARQTDSPATPNVGISDLMAAAR
jgi:hypothetical protein